MADPLNLTGLVDVSSLIDVTNLFGATVQAIVNKINFLVGGIVGLYIILILLRWREYRTVRKLLIDVKEEIRDLNKNLTGKLPKSKKSTSSIMGMLIYLKERINRKKKAYKKKSKPKNRK